MIDSLFGLDPKTWGVTAEHLPGLKALLFAPFMVILIVRMLRVSEALRIPVLRRVAESYRAAPLTMRVVSWLMLTSGIVHLALLPHHINEGESSTAWLFGVDVVLLFLGALAIFRSRRWRWGAVGILVANLVFYIGFTANQREPVDQLGIATKTIELLAIGFLLYPHRLTRDVVIRRRRWVGATAGFLAVFTVAGAMLWAVSLNAASAEPEGDHHHSENSAVTPNHHKDDPTMAMVGDTTSPPTTEQIAAADKLAADTKAAIEQYQDVDVAIAAGYKPDGPALDFAVHYTHKDYDDDGHILDPDYPETLVYSDSRFGEPVLLGVMYSMPHLQRDAPAPGGSITVWHLHSNICFGPLPPFIAGVVSPFGACAAGSLSVTSGAMMHIWTVDWAGGPYGDPTEKDVKAIVARAHGEATGPNHHQ